MPLTPIEELGVAVADGLEEQFAERSWWNSLKAILFYGPAVLVTIYLIGFLLGIF
ncbi:MAG: hypothetical protein OSB22_05430 [Candidatus Poseidoniales archaeon]|nr:hypothetical protein [Candidatus Poseidoniales archaeon]